MSQKSSPDSTPAGMPGVNAGSLARWAGFSFHFASVDAFANAIDPAHANYGADTWPDEQPISIAGETGVRRRYSALLGHARTVSIGSQFVYALAGNSNRVFVGVDVPTGANDDDLWHRTDLGEVWRRVAGVWSFLATISNVANAVASSLAADLTPLLELNDTFDAARMARNMAAFQAAVDRKGTVRLVGKGTLYFPGKPTGYTAPINPGTIQLGSDTTVSVGGGVKLASAPGTEHFAFFSNKSYLSNRVEVTGWTLSAQDIDHKLLTFQLSSASDFSAGDFFIIRGDRKSGYGFEDGYRIEAVDTPGAATTISISIAKTDMDGITKNANDLVYVYRADGNSKLVIEGQITNAGRLAITGALDAQPQPEPAYINTNKTVHFEVEVPEILRGNGIKAFVMTNAYHTKIPVFHKANCGAGVTVCGPSRNVKIGHLDARGQEDALLLQTCTYAGAQFRGARDADGTMSDGDILGVTIDSMFVTHSQFRAIYLFAANALGDVNIPRHIGGVHVKALTIYADIGGTSAGSGLAHCMHAASAAGGGGSLGLLTFDHIQYADGSGLTAPPNNMFQHGAAATGFATRANCHWGGLAAHFAVGAGTQAAAVGLRSSLVMYGQNCTSSIVESIDVTGNIALDLQNTTQNPFKLVQGANSSTLLRSNVDKANISTRHCIQAPAIAAGGSGHVVGDRLVLLGGTFIRPAILQIATVSSGAVATVTVDDPGVYTVLPTGSVATAPGKRKDGTVGTGTGATFTHTPTYAPSYIFGFGGTLAGVVKATVSDTTLNIAGVSAIMERCTGATPPELTLRDNTYQALNSISAGGRSFKLNLINADFANVPKNIIDTLNNAGNTYDIFVQNVRFNAAAAPISLNASLTGTVTANWRSGGGSSGIATSMFATGSTATLVTSFTGACADLKQDFSLATVTRVDGAVVNESGGTFLNESGVPIGPGLVACFGTATGAWKSINPAASDFNFDSNYVVGTLKAKAAGQVSLDSFPMSSMVNNGDWSSALQYLCDRANGREIRIPKRAGGRRFDSSIILTARNNFIAGDFGDRTSNGGTELTFTGVGALLQVGTDDGLPWDTNSYNGPQGHIFRNLHITHDITSLSSANGVTLLPLSWSNGVQLYAAGTYGIRDFRGGQVELDNVNFERSEWGFHGIQSDIDRTSKVLATYCRVGMYVGPRTDQFECESFYGLLCDHALEIDGAADTRIKTMNMVGCGDATHHGILIRQGSGKVVISEPWFEHLGDGYQGTDSLAFVGAGTAVGYGGNTAVVKGVTIDNPFVYTQINGVAGHIKYLVEVGKATNVVVNRPDSASAVGHNLDAFIAFQKGLVHSSATASAMFIGLAADEGKAFVNNGSGVPEMAYQLWANGAHTLGSTNGRLSLRRFSAAETAATGTITVGTLPTAGQTVIVNGVTYTYRTGTAPLATDVLIGADTAATAAALAARLNASTDTLTSLARYAAATNVVTVTACTPGTSGNAFTLAAGTSAATLSAATLTGGLGGDGSELMYLGSEGVKGRVAAVQSTNYSGGQQLRLDFRRSWQENFTSAPTAGAWEVGDKAWNNAPSAGKPWGWVCTVAGTPGTWVPMGVMQGTLQRGDSDTTLTVGTTAPTVCYAAAMAADRNVVLPTTGILYSGLKWRIIRAATATGAFALNIRLTNSSGTILKALSSAGSWADVEYDGTSWVLSAAGAL